MVYATWDDGDGVGDEQFPLALPMQHRATRKVATDFDGCEIASEELASLAFPQLDSVPGSLDPLIILG